jgi:hypothetical protein
MHAYKPRSIFSHAYYTHIHRGIAELTDALEERYGLKDKDESRTIRTDGEDEVDTGFESMKSIKKKR